MHLVTSLSEGDVSGTALFVEVPVHLLYRCQVIEQEGQAAVEDGL